MLRWFWVGGALLFAQKVVSRTQIEVEGYSVEKVGLPHSPVSAGKNRFAYIEYWAKGKPKPGFYIECLNTQYYTQWSQLLDIPPAGEGKPIRLIGMKEAIVAVSYQEDPLNNRAVQEVGRFFDLKGQPLLPKWVPLSVYDRPVREAISRFSLSPDSSYLLWYAYSLGKKGQVEGAWYAIWSGWGRKVAAKTDWAVNGRVVAAQPDNRMNLWSLEMLPSGGYELAYYDTKANTARRWKLTVDTALYAPWLFVTQKGAFVGALVPGERNLPHESGQVGAWVLGKLTYPFSDTSSIVWNRAQIPAEWINAYKEPAAFGMARIIAQGDTALYVIWEDVRYRSGAVLAYDIWVTRWNVENNPIFQWGHRIEKRQREPFAEAVSFLSGVNETFLGIAFLTERTGKGKLRVHLLNHSTGEGIIKDIGENTAGDLLFLPGRSTHISSCEVICFAYPPPGKNGYQIYHIRF
ncbi:MAG: hypothetical protein RMJ66_01295 [Bacteroidia bacterium]|nr:hypothetical protein [Bacteroidia bacterium]MDW8133679.1 hypothetical protein [Bacteroidia bacterium]